MKNNIYQKRAVNYALYVLTNEKKIKEKVMSDPEWASHIKGYREIEQNEIDELNAAIELLKNHKDK